MQFLYTNERNITDVVFLISQLFLQDIDGEQMETFV